MLVFARWWLRCVSRFESRWGSASILLIDAPRFPGPT